MPSPLTQYIEKKYRQRRVINRIMCALLGLGAIVALIPLLSVFIYVILQGIPSLHLDFFTQLPRPQGEAGGGMANALAGTLVLIGISSLVGVPWGIATGLYLSEYGQGKLGHRVRFSVDLLSSIPSIILGLFVYTLVVIPMKSFSALAGGLALGILMIPTIARGVEELLKAVPLHIREAGLALGLPRWKVILRIILAGNSKGISSCIMLSLARIAGETAPLLFTALSNQYWPNRLDQPIASLPVQIYNYAISPYNDWHAQAWTGALVLVMLVFTLNFLTRVFMRL